MTMSNDLNTLEDLTASMIDSARGYEKAAKVAKTAKLQALLRQQATMRGVLIDILNGEIVRIPAAEAV